MNESTSSSASSPTEEVACFAGGCFWCLQPVFDACEGVLATRVGYIGGDSPNPSYREVCSGTTGHVEAIEIRFDPTQVDFRQLLDLYWRSIDPTDGDGQFADRGSQYRPVIYYHDEDQRWMAHKSLGELAASRRFTDPIRVSIEAAKPFYPAEDEHQAYYQTCASHYQQYKEGSGRGPFLRRTWGDDLPPV